MRRSSDAGISFTIASAQPEAALSEGQMQHGRGTYRRHRLSPHTMYSRDHALSFQFLSDTLPIVLEYELTEIGLMVPHAIG